MNKNLITQAVEDANKPNALKIGDTVVPPDNVFVRCPKKEWKLCQVKQCDGCEYNHGFVAKLINDQLDFQSRFKLRCAAPTPRELFELQIDILEQVTHDRDH